MTTISRSPASTPTDPRKPRNQATTSNQRDPWPAIIAQVSALLNAGISGLRAWDVVLANTTNENHNHRQAIHHLRAHLAVHHSVSAALEAATTCYPPVAIPATLQNTWAAWRIADSCGAPLATALQAVTESATWETDIAALRRQGLAAPQATVWVMATLPIMGFLGATALGAHPLGVLIGHRIGWALILIGVTFATAGWCWGAALVRKATARATIPSDTIIPMLAHTGLNSGTTADQVLRDIHTTAEHIWPDQQWTQDLGQVLTHRALGAPWSEADTLGDTHSPLAATCRLLALAEETGAAAAALLLAHHRMRLVNQLANAKESTAALGPQLVLPVAVGALPAFACWVILPTLWSLGSTIMPAG